MFEGIVRASYATRMAKVLGKTTLVDPHALAVQIKPVDLEARKRLDSAGVVRACCCSSRRCVEDISAVIGGRGDGGGERARNGGGGQVLPPPHLAAAV